ncbi:MAG: DUF421 domain-containing protein [Bacillota bacterium]
MPEWLIILILAVSLYFLTLFAVRVMGKRQPSRMTPFNFVNYMVIAILVSFMALNLINLPFGFIALGVWVLAPIALDYLAIKSKRIHDLVYGKETILVKQGKVMEENLLKARLSGEELLRALRSKNAFNVTDVEFAIMEATGDINVLLKSDKKPITPHDMEWKVSPQTEPQTVILDGNIMSEPLANMGLTPNWLKTQLEKAGVALDNVFLAQVDTSGDLYIDLFDDAIELPQPKVKELVFATLEESLADIKRCALDTNHEEAKNMYSKNADKLEKVIENLRPYLLR